MTTKHVSFVVYLFQLFSINQQTASLYFFVKMNKLDARALIIDVRTRVVRFFNAFLIYDLNDCIFLFQSKPLNDDVLASVNV